MKKILILLIFLLTVSCSIYTFERKPKTNKLEIGSIVNYNPPISSYEYNEKYINNNDKIIKLNNTDKKLKISKWRVLNITKNNVELVPYEIPSYELYIYGPQGYNNGVYILNEICENLYSNKEENIIARSINIEDIENIINKIGNSNKFNIIKNKTISFGKQPSKKAYSKNNSWYPILYELEKNSIINEKNKIDGLDLSDSYSELIESNNDSKKQANSIHPYKNFYNTVDYYTTVKLLKNRKIDYSSILLPNKGLTRYWIASRILGNGDVSAHFDLRRMNEGLLRGARLFDSNNTPSGEISNIFPVVSVNKKQIKKKNNQFFINIE